MKTNNRIELNDTMMDIMLKLAEGNPGAATVLLKILEQVPTIDPDDIMRLGPIFNFDSYGIYGSKIWMLYKDVCGENLSKLIGLMRAVQLGYVGSEKIVACLASDRASLPELDELLAKVKERLPRFQLTLDAVEVVS